MKKRYEENPNTLEFWNDYYEKKKEERVIQPIVDHLPKLHGKVLEIGCGMGRTIEMLHELNPDCEFTGVDFSDAGIRKAKESYDHNFEVCRVEDLDYEDEFDYVLCFETLEHVDDPAQALNNIKRATKDKIIITVPYPKSSLDRGVYKHQWTYSKEVFEEHLGPVKTDRVGNFWFIYA